MEIFKAYFLFTFNGQLNTNFEDNETLQVYLDRKADKDGNVILDEFLKDFLTTIFRNLFDSAQKIPFDLYLLHDVQPNKIKADNARTFISFKLKSKDVEVINIDSNKITFIKDNGTILTVESTEQLKLVRI